MRLDLLSNLNYQSSTIILLAGIEYSARDLFYDVNNYDPQSSDMRHIR